MKPIKAPSCDTTTCTIIEGNLINLPFIAIAGDVVLLDADGSVSDVLRFFNDVFDTGGGTGLGDMAEVFSKIDSGPDASAGPDLGIPTVLSVNAVTIKEAPEGTITTFNGNGTNYQIVSDTPEPASFWLLAPCLLGLAAVVRKRLA